VSFTIAELLNDQIEPRVCSSSPKTESFHCKLSLTTMFSKEISADPFESNLSPCERLYSSLVNFSYAAFILIDMVVGGSLLTFAFLLYDRLGLATTPFEISWMIWAYFMLGGVLILEAFLSFSAMTFLDCRCASKIPRNLATIVAGASFIVGVLAFLVQQLVFNFLNHHVLEYGLSARDLGIFKNFYEISASSTLMVIPTLQIVKFYLSKSFLMVREQEDAEFQALLDQDKAQWDEGRAAGRVLRNEKYKDIRNQFASKYQNAEGESQSMFA
jgi:hypothetical protein